MALQGTTLADGASATAASVKMPEGVYNSPLLRNTYTLFIFGTFNSATVKLQISPHDTDTADGSSEWFDVANTTATAALTGNVEFRAPKVRIHIAGGASPSISAVLI